MKIVRKMAKTDKFKKKLKNGDRPPYYKIII